MSFIDVELGFNRLLSRLRKDLLGQDGSSPLAIESIKGRKVSFCITCMNRLGHLKETLPQNLKDNGSDVSDFIILDYRSSDGVGDWLRKYYKELIESGRITYYRTEDPLYFDFAHAKNVAHKLADGPILCNLDVDNLTGPHFAEFLIDSFVHDPLIFMHPSWRESAGAAGRIALWKEHFILVGGYEEGLKGYGYEDPNLILRLNNLGLKDVLIDRPCFLKALIHQRSESIRHVKQKNLLVSHWYNRIFSLIGHTGRFKANQGRSWGQAVVMRNFSGERIIV